MSRPRASSCAADATLYHWGAGGNQRGGDPTFEIVTGAVSIDQIALREKCSVRHINMTVSLAFLAPGLVKAAAEGRLPRGIGVSRLFDPPAEWSRQFRMLGLTS
jgi:hypothetical protein